MDKDILPYDKTSPESIEKHAKRLIGKRFYDVLADNFDGDELATLTEYYNNPRGKGGLGIYWRSISFYMSQIVILNQILLKRELN